MSTSRYGSPCAWIDSSIDEGSAIELQYTGRKADQLIFHCVLSFLAELGRVVWKVVVKTWFKTIFMLKLAPLTRFY